MSSCRREAYMYMCIHGAHNELRLWISCVEQCPHLFFLWIKPPWLWRLTSKKQSMVFSSCSKKSFFGIYTEEFTYQSTVYMYWISQVYFSFFSVFWIGFFNLCIFFLFEFKGFLIAFSSPQYNVYIKVSTPSNKHTAHS